MEPITGASTNLPAAPGWKGTTAAASVGDSHGTIPVPLGAGFWRKLLAFSGPGYLVAVGYMDPGNWASDLAGGSAFGYSLLSVILLSNAMAILLQALCAKLGIVTGRDLAQACRDHYSRPVAAGLWVVCELAISACDLAEVIGTAIALNLLFGIPVVIGVCLTALDVLLILGLAHRGFRWLEALVVSLVLLIGFCFGLELLFSHPSIREIFSGFIPKPQLVTDPKMLYLAIAILGATVMPHNLYLHSSIVQTRKYEQNASGKSDAIKFATIDSTVALMFALFINGAILVVSAAAFYTRGRHDIAEIQDAFQLLSPTLGVGVASVVFAVALLASGQNSTLTGTLAGQIVMEGFLNVRMRPWLRRIITRALAVIPAAIVAGLYGERGTAKLIVLSQVILCLQLPFAVVPLVQFTSDKAKMGEFVNPPWMKFLAWLIAGLIIVLNVKMLVDLTGLTGS